MVSYLPLSARVLKPFNTTINLCLKINITPNILWHITKQIFVTGLRGSQNIKSRLLKFSVYVRANFRVFVTVEGLHVMSHYSVQKSLQLHPRSVKKTTE